MKTSSGIVRGVADKAVICIAKQSHFLKKIAGNNSAILLTILISANNNIKFENTQTVFTQPIASDMTIKRVALVVPVTELSKVLLQLDKE